MSNNENLTEKDCLAELERVCWLIAYEKMGGNDGKDLIFCRKAITGTLEKLALVRRQKAEKLAECRQAKIKANVNFKK
jgi:hypothetical protein